MNVSQDILKQMSHYQQNFDMKFIDDKIILSPKTFLVYGKFDYGTIKKSVRVSYQHDIINNTFEAQLITERDCIIEYHKFNISDNFPIDNYSLTLLATKLLSQKANIENLQLNVSSLLEMINRTPHVNEKDALYEA